MKGQYYRKPIIVTQALSKNYKNVKVNSSGLQEATSKIKEIWRQATDMEIVFT